MAENRRSNAGSRSVGTKKKAEEVRGQNQWTKTTVKLPGTKNKISVPKPVFTVELKYSILHSSALLNIQNLCQQVLILRSIYLDWNTSKQVVLFAGALRMVPGYEFLLEKKIVNNSECSYELTIQSSIAATKYALSEVFNFSFLRARESRGIPLQLKKLPTFVFPDYAKEVFFNSFLYNPHYTRCAAQWLWRLQHYIQEGPNPENYIDYFRMLNQIEEFAFELKLREYTIESAFLVETMPSQYSLEFDQFKVAPHLLDVGSFVDVRREINAGDRKLKYVSRGRVIERSTCLVIKLEVPLQTAARVRVEFPLNRLQYQLEYAALSRICPTELKNCLFPDKNMPRLEASQRYENVTSFQWFQGQIKNNEQQKLAIQNIVNRTAYPAPYILFGPPGTGKTFTIVESVLQIWKLRPTSRILVTASSNYACNELTKRLLKYVPCEDIFRYFSSSAEKGINEIDSKLLEVSNMHSGWHETPAKGDFTETRIVISTIMNSGRLMQLGINTKMYDYIFIDECGSSKELSANVPIWCIGMDKGTNKLHASIVLAGDPKQLGPVIQNKFLCLTAHNVSLLERMMELPFYQKDTNNNDGYNTRVVTKLLDNYRSHASLFHFSNQTFYGGELKSKGSHEDTHWAVGWDHLPNPKFPTIFHSVVGQMLQDPVSLSQWNGEEANLVFKYVQLLIHDGVNGRIIHQDDIGIVTPYSKQVDYIKKGLSKLGFEKIEIGSTEQFQGREKPIIILSTVRSNRQTVGFLSNPRRLNVALTRAKALMIIVGNPRNLSQDPLWHNYLTFIKRRKGFMGTNISLTEQFDSNDFLNAEVTDFA